MKKAIVILLTFLLCCNMAYAEEIVDNEFEVNAKVVILYNLNDNSILYEKNSDEKVQIASLTKIMTAIVAIENIDDLDSKVTITSKVFEGLEEYSQAGFKVGQEVSYRELLYGVLLPSGADAVNAIVFNMRTEKDFIDLMNEKAKELNMTNTHFDNPIGMDSEDNYSTAKDMATLLMYALKNEEFYKIFTTKQYNIDRLDLELDSTLIKYSRNTTIDVSDILGAKSGFTDGAGLCLASIAEIEGIDYLLINLGSDTSQGRSQAVEDATTIYNYYKENYSYKKVIEKDQVLKTVKNKLGYEKEYDIYATEDVTLYLKNNIELDDLTYTYNGVEEINSKYQKGDKLGSIEITYDGTLLNTYDVYLNDNLKYYHPVLYISIALVIILIILFINKIKKKRKKHNKRRKRKKHKR